MFGTNWKVHYDLAVAERRQLAARLDRVEAYDAELNRLELVPQAEDYNAIFALVRGHPLVLPTAKGR